MIRQTSATELKAQLDGNNGGQEPPFLLDVREPREFEYCRIAGSVLIPLGELARRVDELPRDKDIVVICHHGNRSMQAAMFLQQNFGLSVANLQGGVAAWARNVDPAMKQY